MTKGPVGALGEVGVNAGCAIARGVAYRRALVGLLAEKQLVISVNSMARNAGTVSLFLHAST
jgi:glutamate synthase domain-containing protein 3